MTGQAKAANLEARAAHSQAVADRDLARLNLERFAVKASVDGRITNMQRRTATVAVEPRGEKPHFDVFGLWRGKPSPAAPGGVGR